MNKHINTCINEKTQNNYIYIYSLGSPNDPFLRYLFQALFLYTTLMFFVVIIGIKLLFHRLFPIVEFYFQIKWFISQRMSLSLFIRVFIIIAVYFIVDLLLWVVVLSTIDLFVSFRIASSNDKIRLNKIIISNIFPFICCISGILGILYIFLL